ncbi:hypothetical protein GCK72_013156 [Caenorhabditis remanei]|uniref:DUF38 domain-containing protein n=1 Tax=Caenorhabditis remanei TaxID=31234 RepID=A0A6A5GQP1_CAERE|nr:hypothetical protein GCK72_013156 [Caenorhabditis remanei]KAF1756702.1 hypothetical protein GCK72_013156 [Caenorhabditis remanei]
MNPFLLLLLVFALVRCQTPVPDDGDEFNIETEKVITFTQNQVIDMAERIMKTMDKSIESHNYTELINIHYPDFTFTFCQTEGKSMEGFKAYLDSDEMLKKVKRSKHTIMYNPQNGGVEKLDVHGFRFDYFKYFLLEDDHLLRTFGTIIVRTQYGIIEVVKAIEYCPTQIF